MTIYETTIAKIRELPESLVYEVSDFVEFLQVKQDGDHSQLWAFFKETLDITESDFSDYLPNLKDYEDRLARGEIKW